MDQSGSVVPLGQPGEVCIRGHNVMLNYWNDEEATREVRSAFNTVHKLSLSLTSSFIICVFELYEMYMFCTYCTSGGR